MPQYFSSSVLSGKKRKPPRDRLDTQRYRYLGLEHAEPDLGDPRIGPSSEGVNPVKSGDQYMIVAVDGHPGERFWIPNQGGLIPGTISVFEETVLVGSLSSITQLDFRGEAVKATTATTKISTLTLDGNFSFSKDQIITQVGNSEVTGVVKESTTNSNSVIITGVVNSFNNTGELQQAGINVGVTPTSVSIFNDPSIRAEIEVTPEFFSENRQFIFNDNDEFNGALNLTYNQSNDYVGVGTTAATQMLHVNGNLRLTGDFYDSENFQGFTGDLLVKKSGGGLKWVDQGTIKPDAGGIRGSVQYQDATGKIDGAPNFVFNDIGNVNNVGIGSTLPKVALDVVGVASFSQRVEVGNLEVIGLSKYGGDLDINASVDILNNLDVDGTSTFNDRVIITDDTDSFNLTTGALTVAGGVGIAKTVHIGESLNLLDNKKINLGITSDLQIYHDGTDSYIDNSTGHVYIRNNVDNNDGDDDTGGNIYLQAKSGEDGIVINDDGKVELYLDGVKKLETNSSGIEVFNTVTADNFNGTDSNVVDITVTGLADIFRADIDQLTVVNGVGIATIKEIDATHTDTDTLNVGIAATAEKLTVNNITIDGNDISASTGNLVLTTVGNNNFVTSIKPIRITDTTDFFGTNAALFVAGGAAINRKLNVDGNVGFTTDTDSTSTTSGALVVGGGIGVSKNVNIGLGLTVFGDGVGVDVNLASNGGITTTGGDLYVGGDLFVQDDIFYDEISGRNMVISGIATINQLEIGKPGQILVGITTILDEDDMASDRDDALATQQSIKKYVDDTIDANNDLTFRGDSSTPTGLIDLDSETFAIIGTANEIETSVPSNNSLQIGLPDDVTISGNTTLGSDINTSLVNFVSKVDTSILPSADETYDLGSPSLKWDNVYAKNVTADILGNSDTASRLQTPITITLGELPDSYNAGDTDDIVSIGKTFDGAQNVGFALSLTNTGVSSDIYGDNLSVAQFRVDARGRISEASSIAIDQDALTAGQANKIKIQQEDTDTTCFITFSGINPTGDYYDLLGDNDLKYNSNTNTVTMGNLSVTSNAVIGSFLDVNGNIDLGTNGDNTLTINAKVDTNVLPSHNATNKNDVNGKDLGDNANYWRKIYVKELIGSVVTATATSAETIETVSRSTNSDHYLTFVDSNNSSADFEKLYTDAGITYNPSTNVLEITGETIIGGLLSANGDVNLGNANTDTISFIGRVDTSILPLTNGAVNVGSTSRRWDKMYANEFVGAVSGVADKADTILINHATANNFKNITFVDNDVVDNAYDELKIDSEDDKLAYNASTNTFKTVNAIFNGNVDLGSSNSHTVTFNAKVDSHVLPSVNASSGSDTNGKDFGAQTSYWRRIYARDFVGQFIGNAETADRATLADNLVGGGAGSIPYQNAVNSTTFVNDPNTNNQFLTYNTGNDQPQWTTIQADQINGLKGAIEDTNLKGQKGDDNSTKGQKGDDNSSKGQKGDDNSTKGQKGDDNSSKGDKGDKGDSFEYEDFTPGQIGNLKGDKGDSFTYSDFTPGQISNLKGQKGATGADNSTKGQKGATGADNSTKGQKGATGADNSTKGQKGATGADNSTKGDKGNKGDEGEKGDKGDPGVTNSHLKIVKLTGDSTSYSASTAAKNFLVYCTGGGGGSAGGGPSGGGGGGGTAIRAYNETQMGSGGSCTIGAGGSAGDNDEQGSNNYSFESGGHGGDTTFTPNGTGNTCTGEGGRKSQNGGGGEGGEGEGDIDIQGMDGSGGNFSPQDGEVSGGHGGASHFQHHGAGGNGADGEVNDNVDDETFSGTEGNAGQGGIIIIIEYG